MAQKFSDSALRFKVAEHRDDGYDVAVRGWTDSHGASWQILIELKKFKRKLIATRVELSSGSTKRGVTTSLLNEVPMRSILSKLNEHLLKDVAEMESRIDRGNRTGRPFTEEDLLEIARLYREALSFGFPAQRYIAERFDISTAAAGMRIRRARQIGVLEPVEPGQPRTAKRQRK